MTGTIPLGTAKLIGETIGRALFFPVWWYSRGLAMVSRAVGRSVKNQYINLGLGVWLTNLFVPMYGATDIAGRVISFFIRFFMIIVRGFALLLWIILVIVFFAAYLSLLPFSVFGFVYHVFVF